MNRRAKRLPLILMLTLFVGCVSNPPDRMQTLDDFLTRFGMALGEYDPKMVATLLLPPDDTPEGKVRADYVPSMNKAIAHRKKNGGYRQDRRLSFKDTETTANGQITTLVTTGVFQLPDGECEEVPIRLNVTLTDKGWKIVTWSIPDET